MRVAKLILVVEPGTGRTGKLAMVAYQFQQEGSVSGSTGNKGLTGASEAWEDP